MKQKYRIVAGIVTYNPDIDILKKNISSIEKQVEHVYIYDNGSANSKNIKEIENDDITVFNSSCNVGIARALNLIFEASSKEKFDWVITLDQDSICSENHVEKLYQVSQKIKKAAIVAPIIVDRDVGIIGHNTKEGLIEVRTCITSGALTSVNAWREVGGFDEKMFIDCVDFDFCYSLREHNYSVIQVKSVRLSHKIGNSTKKKFLICEINVKGHDENRKYYMARNRIYIAIKHHLWIHFIRNNLRNIKQIITVILFEDNKKKKIVKTIKGWRDGYKLLG